METLKGCHVLFYFPPRQLVVSRFLACLSSHCVILMLRFQRCCPLREPPAFRICCELL